MNDELVFSTIYILKSDQNLLSEANLNVASHIILLNDNSLKNFNYSKEDLEKNFFKECQEAINYNYVYLKILHRALSELKIKNFYDMESNGRVLLYKNPVYKEKIPISKELYDNYLMYTSEDNIKNTIEEFMKNSEDAEYLSICSKVVATLVIDMLLRRSAIRNFLKSKNLEFNDFYALLESQHIALV